MENCNAVNVESNEVNQLTDDVVPAVENQGDLESKPEINGEEVRGVQEEVRGVQEEVRGVLELIASTGRFWCEWNHLRNLLSYKLKQVISEYPEASMSDEQQIFALGETVPELVNRLDNELHNFADGAPFTLQRICEILLAAQGIYPKLSKLVLALEKNLLVTSTLAMSSDSPPTVTSNLGEPDSVKSEKRSDVDSIQLVSEANGVEPAVEVKDEIMTEAEEGDADVNDDMTIDTETFEARTEAPNLVTNPNSNL